MGCWWLFFFGVSLKTLPTVVIDPGHGGTAEGAWGVCETLEKNITLAVSEKIVLLLQKSRRVHVVATRTEDADVALKDRSETAALLEADVFVSIHANASENPHFHGVEVFYAGDPSSQNTRIDTLSKKENTSSKPLSSPKNLWKKHLHKSKHLAEHVVEKFRMHLTYFGRGSLQAPFWVLKNTPCPSVLIELGFLSHPEECLLLTEEKHQWKMAEIIVEGILEWLPH